MQTKRQRNTNYNPSSFEDKVRPKKNLGQHFLVDLSIAQRIADTVDLAGTTDINHVLEVGPGMGVMTQFLIQKQNVDLKVVELDGESVSYLKVHYPSSLDKRIIEADFLKLNLAEVFTDKDGNPMQFTLTGNYPYNISSQIFFKVVDNRDLIPLCTGMIQKEVAERLAAAPGSKAYGILSVLIQVWYDIDYLFTVPPGVFNPPPKVQSAVVSLKRNQITSLPCNYEDLRTLVKAAFSMRRKTLRNCLRQLITQWQPERADEILKDPLFDLRAEQISVQQYIDLTVKLITNH